MPQLKIDNYAPFGVGDRNNQFWVHAGSYTAPFHTLESAKQYCRQHYRQAGTYIRDRSGRLVWKRTIEGKEYDY
jgi:hypothetical protein